MSEYRPLKQPDATVRRGANSVLRWIPAIHQLGWVYLCGIRQRARPDPSTADRQRAIEQGEQGFEFSDRVAGNRAQLVGASAHLLPGDAAEQMVGRSQAALRRLAEGEVPVVGHGNANVHSFHAAAVARCYL